MPHKDPFVVSVPTLEVRAVTAKLIAILEDKGYRVSRTEAARAEITTRAEISKNYRGEPITKRFDRYFAGATKGGVYIPSGRTKEKGARLWAAGVRIEVPLSVEEELRETFEKLGYVADKPQRPSYERKGIMTVRPKSWEAALPRLLKMERASEREAWLNESLAMGLKGVAEGEDEMEKRTLAERLVQGYNLTRESVVSLMQDKDKNVRTNIIGALPILKEYFEAQVTLDWRTQLAGALPVQRDALRKIVQYECVWKRSNEAHALGMLGLPSTDTRTKYVIKEVSKLWLEAQSESLETSLIETVRKIQNIRLKEFEVEAISEKDGLPTETLKTMFAGREASQICEMLEQAIREKKSNSLSEIVSAALMSSYQSVLIRTLGVMAWKLLGWERAVEEVWIGTVGLEKLVKMSQAPAPEVEDRAEQRTIQR